MRIIGLGGYAQSGKDSLANQMVDLGWSKMAFADTLRDALLALNPIITVRRGIGSFSPIPYKLWDVVWDIGWDNAKVKYPEVRRLLQVMGTEVGRNLLGPDVWVDILFKEVEKLGVENLVISDVRFPNEIAKVRELGGVAVWINRPGVGPVNAHVSDNALTSADFSFTVMNNGSLEDLAVHSRVLNAISQEANAS